MINRIIFCSLFILFYSIGYTIMKAVFLDEENCIYANSNWDSLYSKTDLIPDTNTCTQISNSCCHMYIKELYNPIEIIKSYCFTLTGLISDIVTKFQNDFTDELMWYSQFSHDNNYLYYAIGSNLNYTYYENYTCTELHPPKDYMSYNIKNCAYFNDDGTCAVQKDQGYFDNFVSLLYNQTVANVCNKLDSNGKCLEYTNDPDSKATALQPLLEIMKLDFDLDHLKVKNITDNVIKVNTHKQWKGPCMPIPKVIVRVTCPPTYVGSNFISLNKIWFFIVFILLL